MAAGLHRVAAQQVPAPPAPLPPPPAWATLKADYDYDRHKPLQVTEEPLPDPEFRLSHLRFTNLKGQTVTGLLLRPRAEGVYPCVLLLHGLGDRKETMTRIFGRALAARGIASLALDADLHGERKRQGQELRDNPLLFGSVMNGGIFDYRQALDWLAARKDIDSHRIGMLGYSMGAMMGSILSGVDERIQATVLCVGGDPVRPFLPYLPRAMKPQIEAISPSNYVGHISPRPLLMINATHDRIMKEEAARRMQDAARPPKEILWADSGHILPASSAVQAVDWLAAKLARPAGR